MIMRDKMSGKHVSINQNCPWGSIDVVSAILKARLDFCLLQLRKSRNVPRKFQWNEAYQWSRRKKQTLYGGFTVKYWGTVSGAMYSMRCFDLATVIPPCNTIAHVDDFSWVMHLLTWEIIIAICICCSFWCSMQMPFPDFPMCLKT